MMKHKTRNLAVPYMCIRVILELKRPVSVPDSWFLLKWKCFVLTSRSRPGVVVVEIGTCPMRLLSARSSQKSSESRPSEDGIVPVNWFEFSARKDILSRLPSSLGMPPLKLQPATIKVVSCTRFPIEAGSGPPRSMLKERSRKESWVSCPMLSLSVPCRLTLDSLLQKPKAIFDEDDDDTWK
jgi:hypothetical protein